MVDVKTIKWAYQWATSCYIHSEPMELSHDTYTLQYVRGLKHIREYANYDLTRGLVN